MGLVSLTALFESLDNIRRYGDRSPSHLWNKTEFLFRGKSLGHLVDIKNAYVSLLPYFQVFEPLSPVARYPWHLFPPGLPLLSPVCRLQPPVYCLLSTVYCTFSNA